MQISAPHPSLLSKRLSGLSHRDAPVGTSVTKRPVANATISSAVLLTPTSPCGYPDLYQPWFRQEPALASQTVAFLPFLTLHSVVTSWFTLEVSELPPSGAGNCSASRLSIHSWSADAGIKRRDPT